MEPQADVTMRFGSSGTIFLAAIPWILSGLVSYLATDIWRRSLAGPEVAFLPRFMMLALQIRHLLVIACACAITSVSLYATVGLSTIQEDAGSLGEDTCFAFFQTDWALAVWFALGVFGVEILVGLLAVGNSSSLELMTMYALALVDVGALFVGPFFIENFMGLHSSKISFVMCIPRISSAEMMPLIFACFFICMGLVPILCILNCKDLKRLIGYVRKSLGRSNWEEEKKLHSFKDSQANTKGKNEDLCDKNCENIEQRGHQVAWRASLFALCFVWVPAVCEFILVALRQGWVRGLLRSCLGSIFLNISHLTVLFATTTRHTYSSTSSLPPSNT